MHADKVVHLTGTCKRMLHHFQHHNALLSVYRPARHTFLFRARDAVCVCVCVSCRLGSTSSAVVSLRALVDFGPESFSGHIYFNDTMKHAERESSSHSNARRDKRVRQGSMCCSIGTVAAHEVYKAILFIGANCSSYVRTGCFVFCGHFHSQI